MQIIFWYHLKGQKVVSNDSRILNQSWFTLFSRYLRNTIWINPVYIRIFLARTIISDFLSISMKHPVSFKLNCTFIQCKQQKVLSCFFYSDFCLLIAISQNLNHKVPIAAYSNIIKKIYHIFDFLFVFFLIVCYPTTTIYLSEVPSSMDSYFVLYNHGISTNIYLYFSLNKIYGQFAKDIHSFTRSMSISRNTVFLTWCKWDSD